MPKHSRPSRDERNQQRRQQVLIPLKKRIARPYQTRYVDRIKKVLKDADSGMLERLLHPSVALPPKQFKISGTRIYQGTSRGFSSGFSARWWARQKKPWTCAICHETINPKTRARSMRASIDHIKPWSQQKTQIATSTVCCNGVHWEVATQADVYKEIEKAANLRPAHQGCNSSKGGSKTSDSIAPQNRGLCPGSDICTETKAI